MKVVSVVAMVLAVCVALVLPAAASAQHCAVPVATVAAVPVVQTVVPFTLSVPTVQFVPAAVQVQTLAVQSVAVAAVHPVAVQAVAVHGHSHGVGVQSFGGSRVSSVSVRSSRVVTRR